MIKIISLLCGRRPWPLLLVLVAELVAVSSASAQITVTGALLVERAAGPGETYQGTVTIRNASDTAQTATLSLADYRFAAGGSNAFDPAGSHKRSNTSWITLSQQAVSVPPQSTQIVTYTVTVPPASTADGTYWGVILVEGEDRKSAPIDSRTFTVTPKIRFAVQVVTHLNQTGDCKLVFDNPRVQTGSIAVDVSGQGSRACRPHLKLEVYDAEGALQHTVALRGSYLYPETSARQTFPLAALAPGSYSFLVLADVGADKLQGARFQVQVK